MREFGSPREALPDGVAVEATAPERLVVVWTAGDADPLLGRLAASGHLAVVLAPEETPKLVEISGSPSMVLVDADLLNDDAARALADVRGHSPQTRIVVLGGRSSRADGLLRALRLGLSELIDPDDENAVASLMHPQPSLGRQRVLAVGAHPDDVEIGCAATLLRHRAHGDHVTVLTMSRGAAGGNREERRKEAAAAAIAMSAELLMADLPDTRLAEAHEMATLIERVIAAVGPTTVYVHSQADQHQDHRAVHGATAVAARRVPRLLCYQSPSSRNGFSPTRFVPVDDTVHGKVEVLSEFRSQATRHYLDPDLVFATARYWARQLQGVRYAEPFEVLRTTD